MEGFMIDPEKKTAAGRHQTGSAQPKRRTPGQATGAS
jgi:hypothetical protein